MGGRDGAIIVDVEKLVERDVRVNVTISPDRVAN